MNGGILEQIPRLVVLDFETTMSPTGQRPVEVAAMLYEHGRPTTFLEQLIQPECPIDPWTQSIHGIGDRDVRGAPRFAEVWDAQLGPLLESAVVVAHSAPFDAGVLAREVARLRLAPPLLDWWCTCRLARKLWPKKYPNYKLATLAQSLRLQGVNAHRAGADVRLAAELLCTELQAAPDLGWGDFKAVHPLARSVGKSWPYPRSS